MQLTRLEIFWLLRRLRRDRDMIAEDLLLIEERARVGVNGHLQEAARLLDGERHTAEGVIGKLWQAVGYTGIGAGPPPARKK